MFHLSGFDLNIIPLLLLGLSVGVLSGFTGVGGGFVVTPALIILDVPAGLAGGTSLFWVFLNSLAGLLIHRNHGNMDIKLGIALSIPALCGVEVGVRLANHMRAAGMQEVAILFVSILLMSLISTYTLTESLNRKAGLNQVKDGEDLHPLPPSQLAQKLQAIHIPPRVRFARSGMVISIWILMLLGFLIGIFTGFLGVGGGFIIVPTLTYVVGIPAVLAVGSSTISVVISSFYGGGRYLLSGDVVIPLALMLLSTSIPGMLFAASVTRHVRGVAIRLVFGMATLIVCMGSIFKLIGLLLNRTIPVLQTLASLVTFTGILLPVAIVILLKWGGRRHEKKKPIPKAFISFFRLY
jgi:uncharacterized membrane protein YfcA